jgi:hypothetical protein
MRVWCKPIRASTRSSWLRPPQSSLRLSPSRSKRKRRKISLKETRSC